MSDKLPPSEIWIQEHGLAYHLYKPTEAAYGRKVWRYIPESSVAGLVEALEKIADPRKRDHKEPDAYTELGCLMNIANEALSSYRAKRGE